MRNNESRNELEDKVQASLRGIYTDLKKRIIFPTTVRNLENLYYSKLSQEIKVNLHRSLPQTINLSSKELELSFENQIFDALKFLNYYKLKKLITESITTFLDKLDLQADFEVEPFQNLIKDNIDHNDKIIVEVVGRINHASTANPDIDFAKLNKKLPEVYSSLIVYQQMLYAKYEMSDLYSDTTERVKEETETMIYNHAKLKYLRVLKQPCETIEGFVTTCIKEYEERFETNLQEEYEKKFQIKTFIDTYSNVTKYLTKIFKEHCTNLLGEVPCGVLISPHLKQINNKIHQSVIMDRILNFNDEKFSLYENLIIEQIMIIFETLNFSKRRGFTHLFQAEKLGGENKIFSLFRIVFLTDYAEGSFYTHEQCFKYLENFYAKYVDLLETDDSNICQLLENIETEENFVENQPLIKKSLEVEKKAWDETTQNFENLYAMICLFLAFNQSPEGAYNRDYTATKKYMLKCIFRNLKNGKSQFSNFRILNMIERCASNYINKKCNSDSHHNSPVLSPMSCTTRTYKKKRNSIFSSETAWEEKKQQDFRLIFQEQLYSSDLRPELRRPLEFSLDKISNSSVTSKTIVICIGDLWLGDKNVEEWDPIIKKNPHSEVFTLKWNSNGMSNLFDICVKQLTEFSRASKGVLFGLVFPHISPVLLGYAAYCAYKDLKRASWDETWNEACVTGVYLAHILNLAYNKKDFVVNLCGFGFGSLVVMNCIWELQRLERYDIVYDVLLIGGVVNVASFNKSSFNPAYHQIINCYCKTDYLLKVWHKAADYKLNSIGTEPIFSLDGQIRNIDVSTEVNGHMDYKTSLSNIIKNIDFNEDFNYMLQK